MVVDDLVVCGAEPLFMTDYIAIGKVVPERVAAIVAGHRRGLPAGRLRPRRRRDGRAPGAARRRTSTTSPAPGPAWSRRTRCSARTASGRATSLVAMRVLRAALQRLLAGRATCCSTQAGLALDLHVSELGRTLGEELLEPTRIYAWTAWR